MYRFLFVKRFYEAFIIYTTSYQYILHKILYFKDSCFSGTTFGSIKQFGKAFERDCGQPLGYQNIREVPTWQCKSKPAPLHDSNFPEKSQVIYDHAMQNPDRSPLRNVWQSHQDL